MMIFGYLDPATGSVLMQILVGGLAAVGLGWRYITKATRTMFSKSRPVDSGRAEQPDGTDVGA